MPRNNLKIAACILILYAVWSCANKGNPSGGEIDVIPPVILRAEPENYSTNFSGDEIRIYFDEYVRIKDLQKQLIVSPPMDPAPLVTPLGTANKFIRIRITDTLEPNTTYAFNFGQSIVDNNEENPFSYYKYVFSTGDYIDSLQVKGEIFSAGKKEVDNFVSVMLYEVDSSYTDSIVYKEKPRYITNTLDSLSVFSLENLKAGRYRLVAIKDENNNYTFEQKSDKIGFHEGFITVPTDSFYPITIFKEELDPKVLAPRQAAGQKISFGFEGGYEDIDIELITDVPPEFEHRITKERLKDTLFYWYKPEFEIDTAMFYVRNKTFRDTLKHRFQKLEKDSLILSPSTTGAIEFGKDFSISANVPLQESFQQPIKIIRKDSTEVQFTTEYDSILNNLSVKFEKEESEIYNIKILPGTFTDFFGNQNKDTLNYTLRTRAYSDYSNIRAIITNASYPIIVQLTDGKDEVKYEKTSDKFEPIDFRYLNTGTYNMRVILDRNGNGEWDSGNYLKGIKPEPIIYYPRTIEARANFDNIEEFNLQQSGPYLPEN